jgi:hypothetical protein
MSLNYFLIMDGKKTIDLLTNKDNINCSQFFSTYCDQRDPVATSLKLVVTGTSSFQYRNTRIIA